MDKRKEKALENLRKSTCHYPIMDEETGEMKPCGKRQMMSISLPMLNTTESGQIVSSVGEEGGIQMPVPLCDYHSYLSMATGMFGVKSDDKMDKYSLIAPFDAIHIAESVVNVMIMTGKVQELLKMKDDADNEVRESMTKTPHVSPH